MPTDRLMSLVVAPKDIDGFDPEVTGYMVGVASTVTQATITATPHRPDDTVTIDGTHGHRRQRSHGGPLRGA